MALNAKQQTFCDEYLIDLNATQAAIRAGFKFYSNPRKSFFVYFLIDPRDSSIFYVGKGKGKRPDDHGRQARRDYGVNKAKCGRIIDIENAGAKYVVLYPAVNLTEKQAFDTERDFIKLFAGKSLTNMANGSTFETGSDRAKFNLKRVIPFKKWVRLTNPSERERALYHYIVNGFKTLAAHAS